MRCGEQVDFRKATPEGKKGHKKLFMKVKQKAMAALAIDIAMNREPWKGREISRRRNLHKLLL